MHNTEQQENYNWKSRIKLLLIVIALFTGLFLFLLHEGIHIISATQSFTSVNAQWTQTQKEAINHLYLYVRNHNENDFNEFLKSIEQVNTIRSSIDEIREKEPDIEFIRQGLSSLGITDKPINSMIAVRRYLGSVERFTASHSLWEECSVKIGMIEDAALDLYSRHQDGNLSEEELEQKLENIRYMDESLTAEAQNILVQLGESSDWLRNLVVNIISVAGFILLLFALSIAFYWYKMTRQLQTALDEREVLIAEIHHRVKNNLAVVAGLLELESNNVTDEQLIQALKKSKSRIHSIALAHEKLYEFRDFSNINFKIYVEELSGYIQNTFDDSNRITIIKNIDDVIMNVNEAIPLAIIINEVLINAYKHAFNGNPGKIALQLQNEDKMITLRIQDNGVGLPGNFEFEQAQSLGMKLIRTLGLQLNACILFNTNNGSGTHFMVKFRKSNKRGSGSSHIHSGVS